MASASASEPGVPAVVDITPYRLAEGGGVAEHIEPVILDLERDSEHHSVFRHFFSIFGGCPSDKCANPGGSGKKRSGLE